MSNDASGQATQVVTAKRLRPRAAVARKAAQIAGGVLALLARLAGQLATASRDVHGQVRNSVSPLAGTAANDHPNHAGIAEPIYALLRGTLDLGSDAFSALARALDDGELPDNDRLRLTISILNGIFGDDLAARRNPLALPMTLERPSPRDNAALNIVFIHGLCLHDGLWQQGAHPSFAQWTQDDLAAENLYLRYNSGRHISENARDLADALEDLAARFPARKLLLVGHSMGGLMSRSALQYARDNNLRWPENLAALVALGSPHQGADLEKLGNYANKQLRILPYTAPLTRLGNLRSAGIRDLRYGNLRDSDWQSHDDIEHTRDLRTPVAAPEGIRHLFVAATRSNSEHPEQEKSLAGDFLVSVDSALARGYPGTEGVDRLIVPALDHMGLMWDGRVYDALRHWLVKPAL